MLCASFASPIAPWTIPPRPTSPEEVELRAKLLSRLGRLEAQSKQTRDSVMQVGLLRRVPDDFVGERHVVVVKREPTSTPNWETCEFEERPGPEPPRMHNDACRVFLTEDDMNL